MKKQTKIEKVMNEFKSGSLRSSSGQKVTNPKQAIAIGLSEARRMAMGGEPEAMTKREVAFMKAKGAPRGMIRHEQAESRKKDGESKEMTRREIAFMKAKSAPKEMLKHEKAEVGMKRGGNVRKYAEGGQLTDFEKEFKKQRALGNPTFEWTNPRTGVTKTYTTEYAEEKAARESKAAAKSAPVIKQVKTETEVIKAPETKATPKNAVTDTGKKEKMSARQAELMAREFNPIYGAWQKIGEMGDVSPNQEKSMATEPELARQRTPKPVSKEDEMENKARAASQSYMEMTEPLRKGHDWMVKNVFAPIRGVVHPEELQGMKRGGMAKGNKMKQAKKYASGGLAVGHKTADGIAVRGKTRAQKFAKGGMTKMGKVQSGGMRPHGEHSIQQKGHTKGKMMRKGGMCK